VRLNERVGTVAIEPDGSRAYVALIDSHDIAVIDLVAGVQNGIIDLDPMVEGPLGLAVSRQGRLHAIADPSSGRAELWTIDTVTRVQTSRVSSSGTCIGAGNVVGDAVANERFYFVTNYLSPARLSGFDVASDPPVALGCECGFGSLDAFGSQLALARDGSLIYHGVFFPEIASDGFASVLSTIAPFVAVSRYPVASRGVALTRDQRTLLLAGTELVAYDTLTHLPFYARNLGRTSADSLCLSTSERWLAVVYDSSVITDDEYVSITPLDISTPNRGAITFKPRWRGTNLPLLNVNSLPRSHHSDIEQGVVTTKPLVPGPVDLQFENTYQYLTFEIATRVEAGRLTDLGVVEFDGVGADYGVDDLCTRPPPCLGTSARILAFGRGFAEDVIFSSGSSTMIVDGWQRLSWARAIVDVRITPTDSSHEIIATNPAWGASDYYYMPVQRRLPDPLVPPGAVQELRLRKLGSDVEFSWWGRVPDQSGCTDDTAVFEIWSTDAGPIGWSSWQTVAGSPHSEVGLGSAASNPPRWYVVRARDTAGSLGD
jgi:hypothetical protein